VTPLIYAHRGASGRYPENTMEAFHGALRQRADGIELDVQLTLDEQVVVIHDHRLERTTNGQGLVQSCTSDELRLLRAGEHADPRYADARIPTLEEVLQTFAPTPLRFNIELKNLLIPQPGLEERVVELIRKYRLTRRTVISSFNFDSLLRVKELNPRQPTGLLYVGPLRSPWELAKRYEADQLHVPVKELTSSLVTQAKRNGYHVMVWTVDNPERMRECRRLGVDGIITNYPLRARKALAKR
jgi:glycerophosphoryl diester phosphodiesterase